MTEKYSFLAAAAALVTAALLPIACGSSRDAADNNKTPDGGVAGNNGFGGGGEHADFDTFVEEGAPNDAPSLFTNAGEGEAAAPCLLEPQAGTLYPKNWLAPRFKWVAPSNAANLFELHVTAKNQTKDLIVYTADTSWTMPKAMWDAVREHSADQPMTVHIRAANYADGALSDVTAKEGGDLGIAPVEAPGSIVFWSISGDEEKGDMQSLLKGFTVGEDGLANVLRREDMPANNQGGRKCMGCHTSTPDGKGVAVSWETAGDGNFTDGYAPDIAQIEKGTKAGPRPSFMTASATSALDASKLGMFSAFSRGHWKPGDRVVITNNATDLVWIDLEAKSGTGATGALGKSGDANKRRMSPTWSRDGNSIVYMSGELGINPFELKGPVDLYVMPYANRAGATSSAPAKKIEGASDPARSEYYPALSPDDQWVVFNALQDNGGLYDNPKAELFIIPTSGGNKIRLSANDPPSCSGKVSPGITNSWPKWSPEVQERNGKKYYWVVFSSRRHDKTQKPQLYMSPIVIDTSGEVTTYPAIYFRNQESIPSWDQWGNHTPAWDVFEIEPAVIK
jgi:hypothetical protein